VHRDCQPRAWRAKLNAMWTGLFLVTSFYLWYAAAKGAFGLTGKIIAAIIALPILLLLFSITWIA